MSSPAQSALRRVFIRNLLLPAEIGIHGHERGKTQAVRLNVELLVSDTPVIADRLEEVVDYAAVCKRIRGLLAEGHVNLAETLAERIAALCFDDSRVARVRVRVEKLEALKDAEAAGVEIERTRPGHT